MQSAFPVADAKSQANLDMADRIKANIRLEKESPGTHLSDPALRYVAALYDPRQVYEAPWVPTQTAYSQKTRVFARGSFSTGTTGVGFVVARQSAVSDQWCVESTAATSVGTQATTLSSFTALATTTGNQPFLSTQVTASANNVTSRCVASALYVRYAGTELNRGGDYLLLEEPNHISVDANYSYNTMLGQDGCKRIPITSDWVHVCFTPNGLNEVQFASGNFGALGSANLAIAVSAATGAAQPFEFEYHAWHEYSGAAARAATASFADEIGSSLVFGACNMFQQLDCVLGLDGLMRAIHAQARNISGCKVVGAHVDNWAGLLPYLPALASGVGTLAMAAGSRAIKYFMPGVKSKKKPAKVIEEIPVPPPRTVSLPKMKTKKILVRKT